MSLLDHALEYAEMGFSVVPVKPGEKAPTLVKWEPYQKERATPEQIKEWWRKNPSANIGIVTGRISGICVVDFDSHKPEFKQEIADQYFSDSTITPSAKTPSGGSHLYFKLPEDQLDLAGNVAGLPAIDLRANGNYIVAPPSQNGNGRKYQWIDGLTFKDSSFSFLPEDYTYYIEKITKGGSRGGIATSCSNEATNYNIYYKILQEGRRGTDLFKIGMALGDGHCQRWMIEQILEKLSNNSDPPYEEEKLKATIKSVFERLGRKDRNLADEVREFFLLQEGYTNTTEIQQTLQITTKEDKKNLTVILNRLQTEGMIERYGEKRGHYRPIKQHETEMEFIDRELYEYPIKLPFGLNDICALYPQNIAIIAGSKSSGKTAFLLNLALLNQEKHKVVYLNSEMGSEEWTTRMKNLGCKTKDDLRFKAYSCHKNFHDRMDGSDTIYIVDYLEINENFYEIGGFIRRIHEKLGKGLCFIAIQKKRGETFARGGEFTNEKARLYLSMEFEEKQACTKMTIVDAKANKLPSDVRGLSKRLKILGGSTFHALDKEWSRS